MRRHTHHHRRPQQKPHATIPPRHGGHQNNQRRYKHNAHQNNAAWQSFAAAFDGDMRIYAGIIAFVCFWFCIYVLGIIAEAIMAQLLPQ
jgi:hypothetical protein